MQTTGKVLQVLQRNACCENVRKTSSQIYPEACVDPETFRSASLEVIKKSQNPKNQSHFLNVFDCFLDTYESVMVILSNVVLIIDYCL